MKKRLLSLLLVVLMVVSLAPVTAAASENQPVTTTGDEPIVVTDADTRYTYGSIFDNNNTRYDGRVWSDKTVSSGNLTYYGNVHESGDTGTGAVTVNKSAGEEFLVSYSALASTTSVIEQSQSPLDMVLVLDLSPMSNSLIGKTQALLNAVKNAIDAMMAANPANRVAIVAYSSQAEILLPLGTYSSVTFAYQQKESDVQQGATVTCTYTTENSSPETKSFIIGSNRNSGINKYTQMGIYAGMDILESATDITVSVGDGDVVTRQPVLILLSEGEPKIASTSITNPTKSVVPTEGLSNYDSSKAYYTENGSGSGVEIIRNYGLADGKGDNWNARHAQTFATLLTAAYMKKQVTEHYFGAENAQAVLNDQPEKQREALVYTVGIHTDSANSPSLARMVLDPSGNLDAGNSVNQLSNRFQGYVSSYFSSDSVEIMDIVALDGVNNIHKTEFKYDESLGLTADDLKYNDMYFDVTGSGANLDFGDIFGEILTDITSNAASGAIEVVEDGSTGVLSYTDPIGEYMEVKDVKALIINDVIYRTRSVTTSGNRTTYTFSGTSNNPVYGAQSINHIEIYVDTDDTGMQTFHVNIPAQLLPLRLTTIMKDNDGNVVRYSHNSMYPFRLVYSVGFQDNVLNADGSVNMDKVSEEYITENTDSSGRVRFYEGCFSGDTEPGIVEHTGQTVGDAFVAYTPAHNNPFYYVREDTPLYTDEACTVRAKTYDSSDTYYFKINYYTRTNGIYQAESTSLTIERPATYIREEAIDKDAEGLFLRATAPRLGNLAEFKRNKANIVEGSTNATDTAEIYLYLYYVDEDTGPDPYKGHFEVYQGNNGYVAARMPEGTLTVTKEVVNGENANTDSFSFTAMFGRAAGLGAVEYDVPEGSGIASQDGGNTVNFTLKAGESAVFHLDPGTTWSVEETSELGSDWTTAVTATGGTADGNNKSASGTMEAGGTANVAFTNTYITPTGTLTVAKNLVSGNEPGITNFDFTLTLNEALATIPAGVTQQTGTGSNYTYSFILGRDQQITFTIPEDTEYTVTETSPGDSWTTVSTNAIGTIQQGQNITAEFTNTAPGKLIMSKNVIGSAAGQTFNFTLKVDGQADQTFTLADDQTKEFILPAGTSYTVEETDPGANWITTVNGAEGTTYSGTIEAGKSSTVAFVNSQPGTLTVSKTVEGSDTKDAFTFTITAGSYTDTFELADDGSKTFTLPAGTTYTVTEADPGENWTTSVNGVDIRVAAGTITAGENSSVEFVNTYSEHEPAPGTLTVSKTVEGSDTTDAFTFTLSVDGRENQTFTLADGSSQTFTIPSGAKYTVAETAPGENWTTSVNGEEGLSFTGTMAEGAAVEAKFVNTYTEPEQPETEQPSIPTKPSKPAEPSDDGPQLEREDHFGYIVGRTDDEVFPNANMTRAEVATIFFRLLTDESRAEYWSSTNSFTDVSSTAWYNNAVSTMANAGVINGYEDGTFRPDAPITRAEFAAMAVRFYGEIGEYETDCFNDISSTWARNYINRAAELGLVGGYDDGGFHPDANITRAEAVKIINGVLGRRPDADHLHADMKTWTDNADTSAWYYADIQEATNSHTYTMGASFETWKGIEPLRDWEVLEKEWSSAYGA